MHVIFGCMVPESLIKDKEKAVPLCHWVGIKIVCSMSMRMMVVCPHETNLSACMYS